MKGFVLTFVVILFFLFSCFFFLPFIDYFREFEWYREQKNNSMQGRMVAQFYPIYSTILRSCTLPVSTAGTKPDPLPKSSDFRDVVASSFSSIPKTRSKKSQRASSATSSSSALQLDDTDEEGDSDQFPVKKSKGEQKDDSLRELQETRKKLVMLSEQANKIHSKNPSDQWKTLRDFCEEVSSDPTQWGKLNQVIKSFADLNSLIRADLENAGVDEKTVRGISRILKARCNIDINQE